jgi:hypothetical protein
MSHTEEKPCEATSCHSFAGMVPRLKPRPYFSLILDMKAKALISRRWGFKVFPCFMDG